MSSPVAPNLPRPAAIIGFGVADIIYGLVRFTGTHGGKVGTGVYGPLWVYGVGFTLIGIAILFGFKSNKWLFSTTLTALGLYTIYAVQIIGAYSWVSAVSPIIIGALHSVLFPYWRKVNY